MGYDFTGGRISHFSIDFAWVLQQCSAKALPVIFLENLYNKNDVDWRRLYLDILGRNVVKDADV